MKAVPVLAATIQLSQAAADGCQSATSLERRHAAQVRADCPPVRLLEFLCSEAGTAVDRAAEQVRGSGSGLGLGSHAATARGQGVWRSNCCQASSDAPDPCRAASIYYPCSRLVEMLGSCTFIAPKSERLRAAVADCRVKNTRPLTLTRVLLYNLECSRDP